MIQKSKTIYKLFHFTLATVPQIIATLFSFSISINIMAVIRHSSYRSDVYLLAIALAFLWGVWVVFFRFSGVFSHFGVQFDDFKSDILQVLLFATLFGVVIGLVVGIWQTSPDL